jgi:transcription elongation factor GreB
LREELQRLIETANPDASTQTRIAQLQEMLATAEIVSPPPPPWEQALFGATVSVSDATGSETQYRIVGPDEIDLDKNWVGAASPVARALLKARVGQSISLRLPAGEQRLTVTGISYE